MNRIKKLQEDTAERYGKAFGENVYKMISGYDGVDCTLLDAQRYFIRKLENGEYHQVGENLFWISGDDGKELWEKFGKPTGWFKEESWRTRFWKIIKKKYKVKRLVWRFQKKGKTIVYHRIKRTTN